MTTDRTDSKEDFDLVVYEEGDSAIELTGYLEGQWKKIGFPGRLLYEDDVGNRVYATARGFRGQNMIFVVQWADTHVTDVFWSWEACETALDNNHNDLLAAIAVEALKRVATVLMSHRSCRGARLVGGEASAQRALRLRRAAVVWNTWHSERQCASGTHLALALSELIEAIPIVVQLARWSPYVLWYSDPATLRGSDAATPGALRRNGIRARRYGTGRSAARPKQALRCTSTATESQVIWGS